MLAVIRIKGELNLPPEKRKTLELLRLFKTNHLVLEKETKQARSMLDKVQDLITFGEITEEMLASLVEKRGRLQGDKKIDAAFLKAQKLSSFKDLAKAIISGEKKLEAFGIKPVFRLRAPRKGFERAGIKKSFTVGGAWGYRAQEINDLIKRMA